jgi:hypothetical protein
MKEPKLTYEARLGKAFESEIRASLKFFQDLSRGELYWFRLMDFMDFYSVNRNMRARHQPGDFVMIRRGVPYLLECKSSRQTGFRFEYVTDNQKACGSQFIAAGGRAYLLIRRDVKLTPFAQSESNFRDEVFAVDMNAFLDLEHKCLVLGRKSAMWDELRARGKTLSPIKPKVWGLSALWEARTLSSSP